MREKTARIKKNHNRIIYPSTFASSFNQISSVGSPILDFIKNSLVTGSVAKCFYKIQYWWSYSRDLIVRLRKCRRIKSSDFFKTGFFFIWGQSLQRNKTFWFFRFLVIIDNSYYRAMYSRTPILRPPSKSNGSGRKTGVVVHKGLDYFITCGLRHTRIYKLTVSSTLRTSFGVHCRTRETQRPICYSVIRHARALPV